MNNIRKTQLSPTKIIVETEAAKDIPVNVADDTSVGYRLKTYFNSIVRGTSGMGRVKDLVEKFPDYYENFINAEIDARKTPKGKEKFKVAKENNMKFIARNKQSLYFAIATYVTLQNCKGIVLSKQTAENLLPYFPQGEFIHNFLRINNISFSLPTFSTDSCLDVLMGEEDVNINEFLEEEDKNIAIYYEWTDTEGWSIRSAVALV